MNERNTEDTFVSDSIAEVRRETQDYRPRVDYSGKPIDKIYVFRGPQDSGRRITRDTSRVGQTERIQIIHIGLSPKTKRT